MFERFLAKFSTTDRMPINAGSSDRDPLAVLVTSLGGCTFDKGLYRVHTEASASAANQLVGAAFPEFRGRLSCFGFDWLGRQFSLDRSRGDAADPEVLMLEPGTGEALHIPVSFSCFHDEELVDYSDEALAAAFFSDWMAGHERPLAFTEVAAYRTPLFLGGRDDPGNLEISDLDVYWTLTGQLRVRAMNLPGGTTITEVKGTAPGPWTCRSSSPDE